MHTKLMYELTLCIIGLPSWSNQLNFSQLVITNPQLVIKIYFHCNHISLKINTSHARRIHALFDKWVLTRQPQTTGRKARLFNILVPPLCLCVIEYVYYASGSIIIVCYAPLYSKQLRAIQNQNWNAHIPWNTFSARVSQGHLASFMQSPRT